ncbi:hypothetical protein [Lentzea sp. NBRC 105346]|uniref:hypothetical protein n=1 Tax=Lentzea sp. NBRC 105346 TaxID=3032205 RepID=UPI0025563B2D|nr:hypothetical protein [Lentzea sp. NBRC 105346]
MENLLRRVLDKIDQAIAAHRQAADLAEQARDLLGLAGSGTLQADVEQACALFTRVIEGINEPEGQISGLATAADLIRSYLHGRGVGHETKDVAAPSGPPAIRAERLDEIRRESCPRRSRAPISGARRTGNGSALMVPPTRSSAGWTTIHGRPTNAFAGSGFACARRRRRMLR